MKAGLMPGSVIFIWSLFWFLLYLRVTILVPFCDMIFFSGILRGVGIENGMGYDVMQGFFVAFHAL